MSIHENEWGTIEPDYVNALTREELLDELIERDYRDNYIEEEY